MAFAGTREKLQNLSDHATMVPTSYDGAEWRHASSSVVSYNHFVCGIPPEFGGIPVAVSLDLRGNDLAGVIPQRSSAPERGKNPADEPWNEPWCSGAGWKAAEASVVAHGADSGRHCGGGHRCRASAAVAVPEDCSSAASEDWFRQARLAAVKWILETRGCFGFGHRTAYLAIAYFDRFFLRRRVDRAAMPWAARLLSVACVSVAAKMEEYCAPALSKLDAGGGYEFCSASVRRMELLVLSTLGWRMAAVTPFDYLPCFSSRLDRHDGRGGGGHDPARVALKSIGSIFATAEAGSVLDYRPSTVAAAAILAASYEALLTKEALESKMDNLSPSCPIEKEHVHACYSMMVGDLKSRMSHGKRSLPCPDSNEVATSTYDSVLVDDVADTAAFIAAVSEMNKQIRLAAGWRHRVQGRPRPRHRRSRRRLSEPNDGDGTESGWRRRRAFEAEAAPIAYVATTEHGDAATALHPQKRW
ncbi:cyclin-D5-2-like [Triticum aestivum]|uniref:cyclin-D5-2-like n=1 Tax=Triticum aestivum TaxID=4565 RepID=UPI001D00F38D|nr:cyclin-D5-2-like [Triticum aestivum]